MNRFAWRRLLVVLWPSFLMAGVLAGIVFWLVDPSAVQSGLALSRMAIYTCGFFVFWAATAVAGALSVWMWSDKPIGAPEGS